MNVNWMRDSNDNHVINIRLDSYDDIYSDFDSRGPSVRAISDDFLQEIKRASKDKPYKGVELELTTKKRDKKLETVIEKRLHEHFKKHYALLSKEKRNINLNGALLGVVGVILMLIGVYVMITHPNNRDMMIGFLIILLEPSGWFFFWEGLHLVVFEPELASDLRFYKKMAHCKISFSPC